MSGGGNGVAQESSNLQTSQNNETQKYSAASDFYSSKEYLSALQGNSSQSGSNTNVSRTFGNSVTATNNDELVAKYKKQMEEDSERQNQLREVNFSGFQSAGAVSKKV
jgi:hypothetical protein